MVNHKPFRERSYLRARWLAYAGTHEILGGLNYFYWALFLLASLSNFYHPFFITSVKENCQVTSIRLVSYLLGAKALLHMYYVLIYLFPSKLYCSYYRFFLGAKALLGADFFIATMFTILICHAFSTYSIKFEILSWFMILIIWELMPNTWYIFLNL